MPQASPELSNARDAAIARKDAAVAEAHAEYQRDRKAEDRRHAEVFNRIRETYKAAWEAAKASRPNYEAAEEKRKAAIAEAEQQLDADIRSLFLEHGISPDTRHN